MRRSFYLKALITCTVERYANWYSLFQMQFGQAPFQMYFHVALVPGGFFGLYYQEFILRTHLQNLPSKMRMSEISCCVVCRDRHLERASVSISGKLVSQGTGIQKRESIHCGSYEKKSHLYHDSEDCIIWCIKTFSESGYSKWFMAVTLGGTDKGLTFTFHFM